MVAAFNSVSNTLDSSFRIVMTPEDKNVVADFSTGTVALTVNANEGGQVGVARTLVSSQVGNGSAQR